MPHTDDYDKTEEHARQTRSRQGKFVQIVLTILGIIFVVLMCWLAFYILLKF